jgi:nucleoside 2-deoxyribosyltransferase
LLGLGIVIGGGLMQIFLAAPLFSESEREFNEKVAEDLREGGFDVWMAQEAPFIKEGSHEEKKRIYEKDVSALRGSDVVVAVLDGVEVDSGVAFEMGFAKALGKPIIGLKTDYRTFSRMEEVNLMLEVSMRNICETIDEVMSTLKSGLV